MGSVPQELVDRAISGDRAATNELLQQIGPVLLRAIRGMVPDKDQDDVLQEAMISLLKGLPNFRGNGGFISYARSIAVRRAYDFLRTDASWKQKISMAMEQSEGAPPVPLPDVRLESSDRLRPYLKAVAQLSPEQAETFLLRNIYDLSIKEVAAATGAPVNTVRSRLRLAKKNLRRLLTKEEHVMKEVKA